MADWYGTTRTNYVRVTDIEAVKKEFAPFAVAIHGDKEGRICLISEEENGGWPSSTYADDDEDEENELEFDFDLIVSFLVEGEVLVVVSAGSETMRYITGDAHAYAWDGRHTSVDLDDIYDKVKAEFGVTTTRAEY